MTICHDLTASSQFLLPLFDLTQGLLANMLNFCASFSCYILASV
nr:MAG TPA: hypothetical protein [Caudoviricetes sp.]